MDFYNEVIKQKKTVINLPIMKTKDGRYWFELEPFMLYIAKVEKEEIDSIISHIPKSYFKTVNIEKRGKVKYIDKLATGMVAGRLDNFDLFKFVAARTISKFDKYYPMLMVESMHSINSKIGNLSMLSNDISNIDKARNDLLHQNEKVTGMTTQEKADFYDDLHNLQWERRRKKIKFEYLKLFRNFFENHNIKGSEINQLLNSVNGITNLSVKKIYNNRATTYESKQYLGSQNKQD